MLRRRGSAHREGDRHPEDVCVFQRVHDLVGQAAGLLDLLGLGSNRGGEGAYSVDRFEALARGGGSDHGIFVLRRHSYFQAKTGCS